MRLEWLPEILQPPGKAEASMVSEPEIVSWPLVRMLVWPESAGANVMAVPLVEKVRASRSDPSAESAVVVTIGLANVFRRADVHVRADQSREAALVGGQEIGDRIAAHVNGGEPASAASSAWATIIAQRGQVWIAVGEVIGAGK